MPNYGEQRNALGFALMVGGVLGLVGAVAGVPELGATEVAAAGPEGVSVLRWLSLLCGWLLLPAGLLSFAFPRYAPGDTARRVTETMLAVTVGFLALATISHLLMLAGSDYEGALYFPVAVFSGPTLHVQGLAYAALFVVLLLFAVRVSGRLNALGVWIVGLALLVLGNLAQGGADAGILKPLYESGIQYYHDAVRITDWRQWLAGFNAAQSVLGTHAQTHPPFAVLLHRALLSVGGAALPFLAGSLTFLSSLSILLVHRVMRCAGLSGTRSAQFALLFAVFPAFGIYGAVSLDGVIAMSSTILLLGMVKTLREGLSLPAVTLFVVGAILTNALSFGGVFLVGTAGLVGLWEVLVRGRFRVLAALAASVAVGAALHVLMLRAIGYDHVGAFALACRIENPFGFLALHAPGAYAATRGGALCEVALFLPIGVLAVLLSRRLPGRGSRGPGRRTSPSDASAVFVSAVAVLAVALLAGAYRTGEAARPCLYLYPYFLLVLTDLSEPLVRSLVVAGGVQTILMQSFGSFFW